MWLWPALLLRRPPPDRAAAAREAGENPDTGFSFAATIRRRVLLAAAEEWEFLRDELPQEMDRTDAAAFRTL